MADANQGRSIDASISGNRLLDAFLRENPSLQSGLQLVTYPAGHVLYRQDRPISYAYFPIAGALALTVNMRDGAGCETTAVGNEGLVGLAAAELVQSLTDEKVMVLKYISLRLVLPSASAHALRYSPSALEDVEGETRSTDR